MLSPFVTIDPKTQSYLQYGAFKVCASHQFVGQKCVGEGRINMCKTFYLKQAITTWLEYWIRYRFIYWMFQLQLCLYIIICFLHLFLTCICFPFCFYKDEYKISLKYASQRNALQEWIRTGNLLHGSLEYTHYST